MTRNEMNLVNMFKAVDWFLTTNVELLKGYQPIQESHARITQGLGVIDGLSEAQAADTKVQTGLKNSEKKALDQKLIKVSNAVGAVAAATNNEELKLIADWPKSLLSRLREGDYYIKVEQVYKTALPLATELQVWGVTLEDIEALNTHSASLQKRSPNRRNTVVVSKQASTELRATIADLNKELKNTTDKLLKPFTTINPTLFGQYSNARLVMDVAATQKPKVNDSAKDATTDEMK
jgi:hypothetical protein